MNSGEKRCRSMYDMCSIVVFPPQACHNRFLGLSP